jgi:hypothetical protein
MIDHGDGSGQPGLVGHVVEGNPPGDVTVDDLLDNITLYWLTNTGISSARFYRENKAGFFEAKNISIPFAISVFPDELYQAPRSWAERAYRSDGARRGRRRACIRELLFRLERLIALELAIIWASTSGGAHWPALPIAAAAAARTARRRCCRRTR